MAIYICILSTVDSITLFPMGYIQLLLPTADSITLFPMACIQLML